MRIFEGQELSVERLKSQFFWSLSSGYLWMGVDLQLCTILLTLLYS